MITLERDAITFERGALLRQAERAVRAVLEDPDAQAANMLCQAIQDLVGAGDCSDSRLCFTLGYCWYHFPVEDERKNVETEGWLRRALTLDPSNCDARFYLGLIQFGEKHFDAARELFEGIPEGYFHDRHENWQELKREELLLCCELFMSFRVDQERLAKLCRCYLLLPDDDAPLPLELIQALLWAARRPGAAPALKDALREGCALIHRLGLDEAFGPEVAEFHQRLSAAYHRTTGLLPAREASYLNRGAGCALPRVALPWCNTPRPSNHIGSMQTSRR